MLNAVLKEVLNKVLNEVLNEVLNKVLLKAGVDASGHALTHLRLEPAEVRAIASLEARLQLAASRRTQSSRQE